MYSGQNTIPTRWNGPTTHPKQNVHIAADSSLNVPNMQGREDHQDGLSRTVGESDGEGRLRGKTAAV